MRDKLWRMAYDRYHTQETDPEKRKENEERYHALVKMLAAVERQNLLQDIEEKKLLNCDADFESFIDGLEGAMMLLAEMAKYPEIKQIIEENQKEYRQRVGVVHQVGGGRKSLRPVHAGQAVPCW